jgi:hypothetical protein
MRRHVLRSTALAAALVACWARFAPADSVFGIRGLGLLGRPLSARAAATGGAFGLFDAATPLNPATLGLFRIPSGWAVGVPTQRRLDDGAASTSLGSTRFPLFGFASPVGPRLVLAITAGEYLDRTWAVQTSSDTVLRDTAVTFEDEARSVGGVSDLRLGVAYRVSDRLLVGIGLHALAGSTSLSVTRTFWNPRDSAGNHTANAAFTTFTDLAVTDFTGTGLSVGAQMRVSSRFVVSGMARVNSRLKAASTAGVTVRVAMPYEIAGGVAFSPAAGISLSASAGLQTWSRAADGLEAARQPRSRDVRNVSVGGEVDRLRLGGRPVPVRLGYRWRQLPFPLDGAALSEHALGGGFGLSFAGGRATVDLGFEVGDRAAGVVHERFTTGYVGVIVRP